LTSSRTPSVIPTITATSKETPTVTPTSTLTIFTLQIVSRQNSNADTIIRGYLSSYASSAGYSNAIVNSITWENGVYTVIGSIVNPGQFAASFPLSVGYSNLLANLNPSSPAPTPMTNAQISSLALPIGLAIGGTAIIAISIGGILYVFRQRRRKVVNIRSPVPETKIFVPTLAPSKVAPMPTDLYSDNMNMMSNEGLPAYPFPTQSEPSAFTPQIGGVSSRMVALPQPINRLKVGASLPSAINNFKPDHDAVKRLSAQLVVSPSMRNLQQTIVKNPFQRRSTYPTADADLPPPPPPPPPPPMD
jgi:hypothetical protein